MNILPKPYFTPIDLRCGICPDEVWTDWVPIMVPLEVAVAAMRAFRCPACGSGRKVLIVVKKGAEA